jgi:nucleotide-binding universal stress UspA family protein
MGKEQAMFEKLLVPLDSSPFAEQVLPPVIRLAAAFRSEIHLINVCRTRQEMESDSCRNYLEEKAVFINKSLPGSNSVIKTRIIEGSPSQKILSYAREEDISLIVMSSHGLSGVTLWPLGSTVDKVLRLTRHPLLIVRVQEPPPIIPGEDLFKRILVPLDGSELGARVVPYVQAIASASGSELVLFHVIETDRSLHTLGRIDAVPILEDEMTSLRQRAAEYLDQQGAMIAGSGAKVLKVIKTGNIAGEIIRYASDNSLPLIALSSHGHSGLESWIIGSVTTKVLHAAQRSLFIVPAIES